MIDFGKSARLKLELLVQGVDAQSKLSTVGATSKEEHRALFDARLSGCKDHNLPPEIVLPGDIVAKTVLRDNSPYTLVEKSSGQYVLTKKDSGAVLSPVTFPPRPKFYDLKTSSGTPMKIVAQIIGLDTLGIILNSYCSNAKNDEICAVCNINKNNGRERDTVRSLKDISESVATAWQERAYNLINLTGGTFEVPETELVTYLQAAKEIRRVMGNPSYLPGVTSFTAMPVDLLERHQDLMRQARFDLVTYNLEGWDESVLREVFPAKSRLGGRQFYIDAAKKTAEILGDGHAGVILMAGPWERIESTIDGCKTIADEGVLPIPVVFHAGRGMRFENKPHSSVDDLLKLYRVVDEIYQSNNFIPSSRNRAAGSEKSFRNSLINEAVLGYFR